MAKGCSVQGCPEPHTALGYCKRHYYQVQRGGTPTLERGGNQYTDEESICAAPDCGNAFRQRAVGSRRVYCSRTCRDRIDKRQQRAGGWVPAHQRPEQPRCVVEGCEKPRMVHGYCSMHHERVRKYGDPGSSESKRRPGVWRVNRQGYMHRWFDGRNELQHRVVMEEHIGRPLWPDENVHHINGDRTDNRIENLELWSTWQPSGQRVADKVAWAREVLARYEHIPSDVT